MDAPVSTIRGTSFFARPEQQHGDVSKVMNVLRLNVFGWPCLNREMEILGWSGVVGVASRRLNLTIVLGSWLSTKAETVLFQDEDNAVRAVGGTFLHLVSC